MKQSRLKAALGAAVMLLCTFSVHAADLKEMPAGLWQINTKMDVPGMPPEMAAKMANGMTMTHCVKPGERKWDDQRAPNQRGEQKCDKVDPKVSGNTVTWKLKCADGTTADGTLTHNGKDAYSMKMNMNSPRGSMTMNMEGKKIADTCEKGQKP
jgi:hypothetical protein